MAHKSIEGFAAKVEKTMEDGRRLGQVIEEVERLCRPRLDTLWADLRVDGLPLWHPKAGRSCIGAARWERQMRHRIPDSEKHLDLLASPIGVDLLARRVASAVGCLTVVGAVWQTSQYRGPDHEVRWSCLTIRSGQRFQSFAPSRIVGKGAEPTWINVPALAKLDPTCEERVDWGPFGSMRLVDIAALVMVAQHLTANEV